MQDEVNDYLEEGRLAMEDSLNHLEQELSKIRAGRATPNMVAGLMVDYYGSPTPMNQVGNVSNADTKTLVIQPWEKTMLGAIEKAIFEANLGVTPQNDGEVVRITIPPLTEERRHELVKRAKALGEDAKVSVRSARQKMMDKIKKAVKDGYPEDMGKRKEDEVQNLTNTYTKKIDQAIANKESDILTI